MNTPSHTKIFTFLSMVILGAVIGTLQYLYDSEMVFHETTSTVTIINATSFSAYMLFYGLVPALFAGGLLLLLSRNQELSTNRNLINSRQR